MPGSMWYTEVVVHGHKQSELTNEIRKLVEENKSLREEVKRLSGGLPDLLLESSYDVSQWKPLIRSFSSDSHSKVPGIFKQIEHALQLLLEGVPFAVNYYDEHLECTCSKLYNGRGSDSILKDVVGKKDAELFPELRVMKENLLLGGDAEKREFRVEKEGKTSSLMVVCEPVYKKNRIQGVITILMDNTSQVAMGDELSQMKIQTEEWKRTEQSLRQAIKSAGEAIEAKNTFLAVMSHEIRTPLNGVLGMAQVLATTSLDAEQKELVDAMVFSGDVLLAIISDILDLSKIESGTMKLEEREFNPRNIVKHVVRTATAATKDRGIKIIVDISDEVPSMVIGDPLRLKQVITNLVFNAVKFTKEGHVRVCLGVAKDSNALSIPERSTGAREASTDPNTSDKWDVLLESGRKEILEEQQATDYRTKKALAVIPEEITYENNDLDVSGDSIVLHFAVADTGIGIPEEAFPSLFEKFTQVHSSTTRKYGGTGLGLAICKQLVDLMGGRISVSSRVGEGSVFSFTVCCKCIGMRKDVGHSETSVDKRKNICYTTAHFHKLQAGLSCSLPVRSTLSCPLSERANGNSKSRPAKQEHSNAQPGRLRRTSSGPPRIECSLMGDAEDSKELQMASSSNTRKPRLLLAEDNKVNTMVAMSMLKRLGLTADVVVNGQEALNAIQEKNYDLVLMDICMPVLDGLEVTRRVRIYEKSGSWEINGNHSTSKHALERKRLPIVAMTANALSDCEEQCVEYGMDGFLTKPITFKKLKNVLQHFLVHSKNKT